MHGAQKPGRHLTLPCRGGPQPKRILRRLPETSALRHAILAPARLKLGSAAMRLREIQGILADAIEALTFRVVQEPTAAGVPGGKVLGLRRIASGLGKLTELPAIADPARRALAHPYFQHPEGQFHVDFGAAQNFENTITPVRQQAIMLKAMVDATVEPEQALSITVRVPSVSTLDDLEEVISDLATVLKQALLPHYEMGAFRLAGFDTGSMWIDIALDTKEALALILAVAAVALRLLKYKAELRAKEDEAKASLPAEQVKMMVDVFGELLKAKRIEWSGEIAPGNATPEDKTRLLVAVDTLTDLSAAGAEVVPALSAPREVKENYLAVVKAFEPAKHAPPQLSSAPPKTTETLDDK
jgi:hypothetical protein